MRVKRLDKLKLLDTWDWRTGDIWMAPPSVLSICSQSNIEVKCCRDALYSGSGTP